MSASPSRLKITGFICVIVMVSVVIACVAFEVYHRVILKNKIEETVGSATLWIQDRTLTRSAIDDFFDRKTEVHPQGLFLINTTFNVAVANPTRGTLNFSVRTNNYGLLSDKPYQFDRDPKHPEYRIVVLGDSMTGPTTSTYQWVDTVEELLNANQDLRKHMGGKEFRVYNLGWVGAGFNTFWKAYQKSGQYFSPDMVVVNFLEIDFPRASDVVHFKSEDEMIVNATGYMEKLLEANPNILAMLMPIYNDMLPTFTEYKLTQKFSQAEPRIKIEIMRDRLPTHLGAPEIENWFNIPHDAHLSDRGGEVYARAMAGLIAERLTGTKIDFSQAVSKHGAEVLGADKPRTRKIVTPLSKLADDPAQVARIKNIIRGEMFLGKLYTWQPYSLNRLLGLGTDGVNIPYTTPLKGGFEKIQYGLQEDEVVYLNVVCTSEPLSLRNAECYHHFHMYAR